MGLLDMLFGGNDNPTSNLPVEELKQMGLSEGMINYYAQEQAKAQRQQAWNNIVNGAANIASGRQGMGARFGGDGGGGGGGSGGIAAPNLTLDGLVERALKFSQVREGLARQNQAAAARAALPELARQLGIDPKVAAGIPAETLAAMMQQKQMADFNAEGDIRKQRATFAAAGINDPAEQQRLIAQGIMPKPEIKEITLPNGEKMSVRIAPDRGTITDLSGNPLPPNILNGLGPSKQQTEGEKDLLGTWMQSQDVKTYASADPIYRSIVKSAKVDSGAADLDMVYGIAKIFDPTSVVREGEIQMANSTGGTVAYFQGLLNQINGGAKLSPDTRAKLLDTAQSRMSELRAGHDAVVSQLDAIAGRRGLNKENIVGRRYDPLPEAPVYSAQAGTWVDEGAVASLRANPTDERRLKFDEVFGAGMAARVLRGR